MILFMLNNLDFERMKMNKISGPSLNRLYMSGKIFINRTWLVFTCCAHLTRITLSNKKNQEPPFIIGMTKKTR